MLCLPRKCYSTVRQILISDVHWEFSKKGTQETVVILTLVSGTENVDNGKDNAFHCEPFVLFQFVPENTISQREKKKKNSKKNLHAVLYTYTRRKEYTDTQTSKPGIGGCLLERGKINITVIQRLNFHAGKCQISTNKQLH